MVAYSVTVLEKLRTSIIIVMILTFEQYVLRHGIRRPREEVRNTVETVGKREETTWKIK
jgi:hypothetical protein